MAMKVKAVEKLLKFDELKKAVGPRIGYNRTTSLQRVAMEVRWVMKMMVCCG